jgi:CubicO group peptidase (beta-lactamase class C family)
MYILSIIGKKNRRSVAFNMVILLVFLVIASVPQSVLGVPLPQSEDAAKIEALVKEYCDKDWFSGSVMVKEGDQDIYSGFCGMSSIQLDAMNKVDTKYLIGSCTKGFTAALILQLVADGRIKLDGYISDYLPYYTSPIGKQVTISNLLEMSSGIKDYISVVDGSEISYLTLLHPWSTEEFVKKFCMPQELEFDPGSKFEYVNVNYHILGAIIEAMTPGYTSTLQEKILDIAKMGDSGVYQYADIIKKYANGYEVKKGIKHPSPFQQPNAALGTGFIYSTVEDFYKWGQALTTYQVLPKEYTEMMLKPRFLFGKMLPCMYFAYGMAAQYIDPKTGKPACDCPENPNDVNPDWIKITYAGGIYAGFQSIIFVIPRIPASNDTPERKNVTITVLSNYNTPQWYTGLMSFGIRNILFHADSQATK